MNTAEIIVCPKQDTCMLVGEQRDICEVMKPYRCPLIDPYQTDRYNEIVNTCVSLIETIYNSEIKKIEANLRLGEMVGEVLKTAKYGSRAVEKLAVAISKARGRTVYPQRLYEAYEVWDTVRTMEKVYEIQKKIGEDISWNWLVKNATKDLKNENNRDVKHEKIQKALRQIENAVSKVETLDKVKDNLDSETIREFEGVVQNMYETVAKIVNSSGQPDDSAGVHDKITGTVAYENINSCQEDEVGSLLDTVCELLALSIERRDWDGVEDVYSNLLRITEMVKRSSSCWKPYQAMANRSYSHNREACL